MRQPPTRQLRKLIPHSSFLIPLVVLAVAARVVGLAQGLPLDYHYDERIYFHESLFALANGLRRESTVSANLPYLLLPVMLLQWAWLAITQGVTTFGGLVRAYIEDPGPFVLLGRAVWAATGVLSVIWAYRIGRRVADPLVGLLGAFFLAGAFLHVAESHFIKNDVPAGLLLLLALDRCLDIHERGARRDYLWAGAWIGLAAATKYFAAAALPAILLAHILRRGPGAGGQGSGIRDQGSGIRDQAPETRNTQHATRNTQHVSRFTFHVSRFTPLLWSALAALIAFTLTTPVLVLDPRNLWENLAWEWQARFGAIPTDGTPQWLFYFSEHLNKGLGMWLLSAALGGLALMALRRHPRQALFLAVPLLYYIAVASRPNNFARYIVPVIPFLCLAAGYALRTIVGQAVSMGIMHLRTVAQDSHSPLLEILTRTVVLRRITPVALGLGALILGWESWANTLRYDRYALAPDTRTAAQAWIEQNVPPGARLVIEGGESFNRTSNLGPQVRPSVEYLQQYGPNSEAEAFFWRELLAVAPNHPTYNLQLRNVGYVARTPQEVNGERVQVPVPSVDFWGRPDYFVLISWRSAGLGPGSTEPFWASLTASYSLVAEFPCRPCFPEDYYAWRIDYATLAQIDPFAPPGALAAGPGVRIFGRKP
jgi:hypothetical protein